MLMPCQYVQIATRQGCRSSPSAAAVTMRCHHYWHGQLLKPHDAVLQFPQTATQKMRTRACGPVWTRRQPSAQRTEVLKLLSDLRHMA